MMIVTLTGNKSETLKQDDDSIQEILLRLKNVKRPKIYYDILDLIYARWL